MTRYHDSVVKLLEPVGIKIDGPNPWDPHVYHSSFFWRAAIQGFLGLGETFTAKTWDCGDLPEFTCRALRAGFGGPTAQSRWGPLWRPLARLVSLESDRYPLHSNSANDLYQAMFGQTMSHTWAYWQGQNPPTDLDQAQTAMYDQVCQKLGVSFGSRLIDIGCGYGGLMLHATNRHQAHCTGLTESMQHVELGGKLCLGQSIEFRLEDYRMTYLGKCDAVASLGTFEHVKNYRKLFEVVHGCLKPGGRFLLHTLVGPGPVHCTDPWIDRYAHPGLVIPSMAQIVQACQGLFVIEEVNNFGADHERTLMAWHQNLSTAWLPEKPLEHYPERLRRMWEFYLLGLAGYLRAHRFHSYQFVFSSTGV